MTDRFVQANYLKSLLQDVDIVTNNIDQDLKFVINHKDPDLEVIDVMTTRQDMVTITCKDLVATTCKDLVATTCQDLIVTTCQDLIVTTSVTTGIINQNYFSDTKNINSISESK